MSGSLSPSLMAADSVNTTIFRHMSESTDNISQESQGPDYSFLVTIAPSGVVLFLCSAVIFIVLRLREMRTASNLLFLSAATSDWLRGLLGIAAIWLHIKSIRYNEANERLCIGYLFVNFFQEAFSFWSIVALTYDRYDLLARPLARKVGAKEVTLILTFNWISCLLFACLPLMGWRGMHLHRLPDNPTTGNCFIMHQTETNAFDRSYLPVYDIFAHVIPLILIVILYRKIFLIVRRQQRRQSVPCPDTRELVRSKAFITVTAFVSTTLLCTLPTVIFLELEAFGIKIYPDRLKAYILLVLSLHFVLNSLIYVYCLKNTLRITGRHGFEENNATVRFVTRWCM